MDGTKLPLLVGRRDLPRARMHADVRLAQAAGVRADGAPVGRDLLHGAAVPRAGAEARHDRRRGLGAVVERAAERDVEAAARLRAEAEWKLARLARLDHEVAEVLVAIRFAVAVHVEQPHDALAVEHVDRVVHDLEIERLVQPRGETSPLHATERAVDPRDDPHVAVEGDGGGASVAEEVDVAHAHVSPPRIGDRQRDAIDDVVRGVGGDDADRRHRAVPPPRTAHLERREGDGTPQHRAHHGALARGATPRHDAEGRGGAGGKAQRHEPIRIHLQARTGGCADDAGHRRRVARRPLKDDGGRALGLGGDSATDVGDDERQRLRDGPGAERTRDADLRSLGHAADLLAHLRARDGVGEHGPVLRDGDPVPATGARGDRAAAHVVGVPARRTRIGERRRAARPAGIHPVRHHGRAEHARDRVVLVERLVVRHLRHRGERHEAAAPRRGKAQQVGVEARVAVVAERQHDAAHGEVPLRERGAELARVERGDEVRKPRLDEWAELRLLDPRASDPRQHGDGPERESGAAEGAAQRASNSLPHGDVTRPRRGPSPTRSTAATPADTRATASGSPRGRW